MLTNSTLKPALGILLGLLLVGGSLSGCSSSPNSSLGSVLARSTISAAEGGTVGAPNGVQLTVPAGVLKHDSEAQIIEVGPHEYDIHIDGEWEGKVGITLPLSGEDNAIVHRVGDTWVLEGAAYEESTVWVTQLSWFSDLLTKGSDVICFKFTARAVVKCLMEKGLKKVNHELAQWLAEKLDNNCLLNLALDAAGSKVGVLLDLFWDGPCVATAGEANPQALIEEGTSPPVASPPVASPPVASPPVASPPVASPPVASPPVASPPVASPPAASNPSAWVTRSGDTVTYHWANMPGGMWPQVDRFRCWRYTVTTHPGGWATDGCGQKSGYSGFPSGSGSVSFSYSGASDSFSIEPWKYGPWLNVGQSWQG